MWKKTLAVLFIPFLFLGTAISTEYNNVIPGLMPVDVYLNFTNKGFEKEGPRSLSNDMVFWKVSRSLNDADLQVEIFGKSGSNVYKITAMSTNYGSIQSKTPENFLGYIATLPYKGSNPDKAQNWLEKHINTNASIIIGKVKFDTYANSERVRILEMYYVDEGK
jgi:hypothetical protein